MRTAILLPQPRLYFFCVLLTLIGILCMFVTETNSSHIGQFLSKYYFKQDNVFSATKENNDNEVVMKRLKRNAIQLWILVQEGTKYDSDKLLNYGNYCGFGSNRAGDGSVIDQCDNCCKAHDICYDEVMLSKSSALASKHSKDTENSEAYDSIKAAMNLDCIPYLVTYQLANVSGNPYCIIDKEENLGLTEQASCTSKVCECDLQFVRCLQTEPCPLF